MGVCCCLQTHNSVQNVLVMQLVLGPSLMVISTTGILCYMQKYLPFIMYYGSALLLFTRKVHCLQTFEHNECTLGYQSPGLCAFIYRPTRVFEILRETWKRHVN